MLRTRLRPGGLGQPRVPLPELLVDLLSKSWGKRHRGAVPRRPLVQHPVSLEPLQRRAKVVETIRWKSPEQVVLERVRSAKLPAPIELQEKGCFLPAEGPHCEGMKSKPISITCKDILHEHKRRLQNSSGTRLRCACSTSSRITWTSITRSRR